MDWDIRNNKVVLKGLILSLSAILVFSFDLPPDNNRKKRELLKLQRNLMELDTLEARGLRGKGVRIAIFDAGFKHADRHLALKDLISNGSIISTYDFVDKKEDVFHHSSHGMKVLACIAGRYEDQLLGAAPEASFLLARTDHLLNDDEKEEAFWLEAAQWAYENGADIIVSTLTYGRNKYSYGMLDGNTTTVSKAGKWASEQGIVVLSSIGNEGTSDFPYLLAPADAEEVISVGASLPMLEYRMPLSARGPNAKAVIKPDIAANGYVLVPHGKKAYRIEAGTSFATALAAGYVACLIEANPLLSNRQIKNLMIKSGHFYPYYDYQLGFGVPKASKIFAPPLQQSSTFDISFSKDTVKLTFPENTMDSLETSIPVYYHFEAENGSLVEYGSDLLNKASYSFEFLIPGNFKGKMRVWFQGYLKEKIINPL